MDAEIKVCLVLDKAHGFVPGTFFIIFFFTANKSAQGQKTEIKKPINRCSNKKVSAVAEKIGHFREGR